MRNHTLDYEQAIKTFGRQQAIRITFGNEVLTGDDINSCTPSFKASLLKSCMKEVRIDSNTEIPVGTEIHLEHGILVGNSYEYLDYGYYTVYKVEKKEDTGSFDILCYDLLIKSMVDYEDIDIEYPISIKDYLKSICDFLEIDFGSYNDNFVNYNQEIESELYLDANGNSLNYTFRDVLDELAQVTASVICIDINKRLIVKYPEETQAIIDEEQLKNINVNFGEKYGPINSIVLSRSADSDYEYLDDDESIAENGLTEIKIQDNQIMNDDTRARFLPEILEQLDGLEYYINDFSSTGITYLDLFDFYTVKISNVNYKCLMLNDCIKITQGIEEQVYAEMPETGETEYKSLSKQDKANRRTSLIVNKVEGQIEAIIEEIGDRSEKTTSITQDIDSIEAVVSDIEDLTETKYGIGTITFEKVNHSQPFYIRVHPTRKDIGLVPSLNIYPGNSLYPSEKIIHFYNETDEEDIEYELPTCLYYLSNDIYDEFYLDFDTKQCYVVRKIQLINNVKTALEEEVIEYYPYPTILINDGDYSICVTDTAFIEIKLMKQNDLTSQFASEAHVQSAIKVNSDAISLETSLRQQADKEMQTEVTAQLELKLGRDENDQVISMINASADIIELNSNRLIVNSTYFKLDENGNITATGGDIGGFSIGANTLSCSITTTIGPFTSADQERVQQIIMGEITPTYEDYEKYDIDNNGVIDILDNARIGRAVLNGGYYTYDGTFTLDTTDYFNTIQLESNNNLRSIGLGGVHLGQIFIDSLYAQSGDYSGKYSYLSDISLTIGSVFDNSATDKITINTNDGCQLFLNTSDNKWCALQAIEDASLTLSGGNPSIYMQGTSPEITFNDNGITASMKLDNGYIYANKLKLDYTKAYYNYTEYTGTTFDTANDLYIAKTNSSGSTVTGWLHCRIVNGLICAV